MPSPMTSRRAAAIAVLAATLIAPWEGFAPKAEPDKLAGGLPTWCYGRTTYDAPVDWNKTYSQKECFSLLMLDIPKYRKPLERCVTADITNHQWAAITSGAYNAGASAMCKSPIVKRLNDRDPLACDSFRGWRVYAGGRKIQGLVNRREAERKFCFTPD